MNHRYFLDISKVAVIFCFALIANTTSTWADAGNPSKHMVASANSHATEAGLEILRQGGSAVDAAIAIQAVLTLVEPQSSGIGGGAFLMHYSGNNSEMVAYDGREKAPASATDSLFLKADGTPESKRDVIPGGRSVGVPGVLAMLALAHNDEGKLPWAALFAPAIKLARNGFAISPRLHMLVSRDKGLQLFASSRAYFYSEKGEPKPVGHILKNEPLANTLELIANRGARALYTGPLAETIVSAVQNAPINPGGLTLEDMASYAPTKRQAVCITYRAHEICGMPPPSSGGVAVAQILELLEGFDVRALEPNSPAAINLISEAFRLAYADRATYLADTEFVDVPVEGLIDETYLAERRSLITPGQIMPDAPAGVPPGIKTAYRTVTPGEIPATSHFSIVDSFGNVLAMTTSVESAFGSRMMVGGFLLNNQLTDFTFAPDKDGLPVANRVAGGKRPLSSMSPTLVMDNAGRPVATLGSPGGPLIISFVAKTLVGMIDWNLNLLEAISLPHFIQFGDSLIVENNTVLWDQEKPLNDMGYSLRGAGLTSGLHGIVIHYDNDGSRWLEGGADPRREGTAKGE